MYNVHSICPSPIANKVIHEINITIKFEIITKIKIKENICFGGLKSYKKKALNLSGHK